MLSMLLLLLFLFGLMVKGSDWAPALCERISVPVCRDMPYNFTRLPNLIGDQDQQSVAMSMHDFEPLIDIKCSVNLKFFLCSVFTPMCTEAMDEPITSCRSVCQEVERSCAPPLANFGIQWPSVLNCSQFPVQNSEPPCMDPSPAKGLSNRNRQKLERPFSSSRGATATTAKSRQPLPVSRYEMATPTDACGTQFAMIDRHDLHNKCVLRCNQHWMFSGEQKRFVKIWMAAWASLCLLATGLTLVTFLLDGYRFAYPKRPVVFIALCHFMYSIAYLLPIIAGAERAACQRLTSGYSVLVAHSLSNVWCVATFILRYYFALTSVVWWLILTMTWYLAAGRKWSQEAIARHSSMFHILAWALPAGLTVIVMVTHEVEANELTSLCFICSQSNSALYEMATPTDACGTQFAMIDRHDLHNKCVLRCNQHWMFSGEQKRFVKIWMAAWASLCLLATGLTLVTFLLDGYRFAYPKRPVVFIALCHFMYSIAYLLPIIAGAERAACQRLTSGYSVLVAHSLSNVWCVATFILRYYFALTSVVWWLILTMTWYLAAGRKWSQEAIARHSSMFHILAWALPAGLTVIVMVTHEVEANELTSLCFICSQSNSALYGFFVGPIALLSAVGVGFMVAGVRSMVRIRKDMRYRACDTELQKLRQLMTKICVFSLLYFVTTLVVLICISYERVFVDNLWRNAATSGCLQQRGDGGSDKYCKGRLHGVADNAFIPVHRRPVVEVYMLNIAMSMTVGVVSCLWVWSKKTVQTWQRFLCRSLLPVAVASKPIHYAPVLSRRPEPASQQLSTGCYHFSLNRTPSKP
ncbi:hypothetical protein M514_06940 [Trichuris suis]|uniref:Uncharacterized protein n=1 Tax=Trichuris suis TaxID=68888 RepID=A0A085NLH8_9BILA|nr:hypothetical protein M514_06940 [Trichuris suis]